MNAPDKTAVLTRLQDALADVLRPQVDVTDLAKPTEPYVTGFVNIGELTIKRLIDDVMVDLFSNDSVCVEVIVEIDGVDDPGYLSGPPEDCYPPSDADRRVFSAKAAEAIPLYDKDGEEAYVIQAGEELGQYLTPSQIDDIEYESCDWTDDSFEPDYESMGGGYDY